MKEVMSYVCDYCNRRYATSAMAYACEKRHIMPKKDSIEYYYSESEPYPAYITVTFNNDEMIQYDRRR